MRWLIAFIAFGSMLVVPSLAAADDHAGVGVGMRWALGRGERWHSMPVVLPVDVAVGTHAVADVRVEIASRYLAIRPGLAARLCSTGAWQCLSLGASAGVTSAPFDALRRQRAALLSGGVGYEQRVSRAFGVRIDVELILAFRRDEPAIGGLGSSVVVRRSF